jgi:hypothetical protein
MTLQVAVEGNQGSALSRVRKEARRGEKAPLGAMGSAVQYLKLAVPSFVGRDILVTDLIVTLIVFYSKEFLIWGKFM